MGAFTELSNPYFNKSILKSRSKFGVQLVSTANTIRTIINDQKENIQSLYGLISDQSPVLKKALYWNKFLGINVPIQTGGEILAKKYNMNVVFMNTIKIKRGFYETTFSLITTDPSNYPDFELSNISLKEMEKQIHKVPEHYFWTQKRFKHKDKHPVNTIINRS